MKQTLSILIVISIIVCVVWFIRSIPPSTGVGTAEPLLTHEQSRQASTDLVIIHYLFNQ